MAKTTKITKVEQGIVTIPNPNQSDSVRVFANVQLVPEFMRFAQWCGTPRRLRQPFTQKELAEEIGVSQDTLTDWKNHPDFWPLVKETVVSWMRAKIPDVIGGLYERAANKGSAKEVEFFLRLAGMDMDKGKRNKNK
ncbi:MAG: phBC6A51 family helix-turn-helix protein [Candidatus Doudnabacteria bacterium]|nr:phBC6A51 family helix-turn-helix protein [Candidatus Doudnabacteria bacterium]